MKISVSSYSFAQLNKDPVALISLAKELGFAAIEYIDTDLETAQKLRAESERIDLPIIAYCVGGDFLAAESVEAEVERLKGQVDIAAAMGVKLMRHDVASGWPAPLSSMLGYAQALEPLSRGCRAITEYAAATYGIATAVENHGFFCQDSGRVVALVGAVNHPNFGVLIDIGNFCCADENAAIATGNLAAMAKHVHAKDFHIKSGCETHPGEGWFQSRGGNYLRGAIIGHGNVPIGQALGNLKRAGYDSYVSIEFEGLEDPLKALRIARDNLERFIQN